MGLRCRKWRKEKRRPGILLKREEKKRGFLRM
jgi:hypothetical protein